MDEALKQLGILALIGALASLGKELGLKDGKRGTQLYGSMIISSVFCMGAAALPLIFPTAPLVAVIGVGALLATLGIAFAERLLEKYVEKKFE